MTTATITYTHPTPGPLWATDTTFERADDGVQFGCTAHYSDCAKLTSPGPLGEVIAEAQLFQFDEDGEPSQRFLRLMSANDSGVELDLTTAEADNFLAEAAQWLDQLRGLRAQMGGDQ